MVAKKMGCFPLTDQMVLRASASKPSVPACAIGADREHAYGLDESVLAAEEPSIHHWLLPVRHRLAAFTCTPLS